MDILPLSVIVESVALIATGINLISLKRKIRMMHQTDANIINHVKSNMVRLNALENELKKKIDSENVDEIIEKISERIANVEDEHFDLEKRIGLPRK